MPSGGAPVASTLALLPGEGGFNLDNFPHVNAWIARIANQPGHVTISHKN